MVVSTKQFIGLPVVTKSGTAVGKVAGFDIETDTGRIASLRVKVRGLVPGLLDQELLVAWGQIVEITIAQVVVQDGVVPIGGRVLASRPAPTVGVHMRNAPDA
ncbi:MAG TPA: PRC-barrel domain-containing protein [Candidatus Methylomirabilis sp.]|nr:PRC-barrel domain-containing protein [Candidatus Methylomirabilis sp.]